MNIKDKKLKQYLIITCLLLWVFVDKIIIRPEILIYFSELTQKLPIKFIFIFSISLLIVVAIINFIQYIKQYKKSQKISEADTYLFDTKFILSCLFFFAITKLVNQSSLITNIENITYFDKNNNYCEYNFYTKVLSGDCNEEIKKTRKIDNYNINDIKIYILENQNLAHSYSSITDDKRQLSYYTRNIDFFKKVVFGE